MPNSIIIIEGADNIGKSTLKSDILNTTNLPVSYVTKHWGPNKTKLEGKNVMGKFIEELRMSRNYLYICDRSPFGEFVYGQMFRGYDPWTYFDEIVENINRLKARFLFISLYADENTYEKFELKSKDDEEKEYQKRHLAKKVSEGFINLTHRLREIKSMDRLLVNCNNYKSLDDRNSHIMKNIQAFLRKKTYVTENPSGFEDTVFNPVQHFWSMKLYDKKYQCSMFDKKSCVLGLQHVNDSGYKGVWEHPCSSSGAVIFPKIVFVGEAPGNYNKDKHSLPFYGDRSGDIFHNALRVLNLLPTEVYMTNVIHCSPKNHDLGKYADASERVKLECVNNLRKEISGFNCPVVALGKVADSTLTALRIRHRFVYHPSYYARINAPGKFITALRKELGEI